MARLEQLERMVEVLTEAMVRCSDDVGGAYSVLHPALDNASRIAAEPVEPTDAEVVERWLTIVEDDELPRRHYDIYSTGHVRLTDEMRDVGEQWHEFASLHEAAAWIRAQGLKCPPECHAAQVKEET